LAHEQWVEAASRGVPLGCLASVAGALLATMATSAVTIAAAAGSLALVVATFARATARVSVIRPFLLAQLIGLTLVSGCSVAMTDEDGIPAEVAFERLWVVSAWLGSLAGALAGHWLGGVIARRRAETTIVSRRPADQSDVLQRALRRLDLQTDGFQLGRITLPYAHPSRLEIELDTELMAMHGYRRLAVDSEFVLLRLGRLILGLVGIVLSFVLSSVTFSDREDVDLWSTSKVRVTFERAGS